ncbi:MAG: GNAT family N-acetyltransferase [Hyphomicrobium sp.]
MLDQTCDLDERPLSVADAPQNARSAATQFEMITSREAFDALEDEWNALFERAGRDIHVFQTFNWNWHWANHFLRTDGATAPGYRLAIVAGRQNGRLVAVWPLVQARAHGVTHITWMGDPIGQYGDVLIDALPNADAILREGWAFLSANVSADVMYLRRVRADASIAPLLDAIGAIATDRQVAPFLDLTTASTYERYEERYTARSKRNRRRLARRIADDKAMTFERHDSRADARKLALSAIDFKSQWLKDRGLISGGLSDPRTACFFADVAEARERPVGCILGALNLDGVPAAIDVSIRWKGRVVAHVMAYDLKHEKSGVGALRLEQSLRDSYAHGVEVFDLMAPGDSYKREWADGAVDVVDWAVPLTLKWRAYAHAYLKFARPHLKAALKSAAPLVGRALTMARAAKLSALGAT